MYNLPSLSQIGRKRITRMLNIIWWALLYVECTDIQDCSCDRRGVPSCAAERFSSVWTWAHQGDPIIFSP